MIFEQVIPRINAEQFNGEPFWQDKDPSPKFKQEEGNWKVKTGEGWRWIQEGDWLAQFITGADRRFYLRSDDYINNNYKKVSDD